VNNNYFRHVTNYGLNVQSSTQAGSNLGETERLLVPPKDFLSGEPSLFEIIIYELPLFSQSAINA